MAAMRMTLFRITTGVAAVYHLVLGLALLVLPAEALGGITRLFLGMDLEVDGQMAMIGKFIAAYLLAFGLMLGLLCLRPVKLRALVMPVLVLFGIRLANKLVFMGQIEEMFGVARGRSVFALLCIALLFGIIAWTRPMRGEEKQGGA